MELSNEFDVPVPLDQAWAILTDIERIAPCMPGAQLQEIEGDEYRGIVKVKVGPITAQYEGAARLIEQDEAGHRVLLQASGRDTVDEGNASVDIRAELVGQGQSTHVSLLTDLTITGKVAQFGSGMLAEVSAELLDQFVANLEVTVLAEELVEAGLELEIEALTTDDPVEAAVAAGAAELAFEVAEEAAELVDDTGPDGSPVVADAGVTRRIEGPAAEPVDSIDAAAAPVAKRVLSVAAVITAVALIVGLGRRRRRRRRA